MRIPFMSLALSAAVLSSAPALAQSNAPGSDAARQQRLSQQDKQFLDDAAEDNQAEIQLCLLAEKRAQSLAVKAFARLMVNDHVGVESRLAALINNENVDVPNGVGKEGQQTMSRLQGLHGADFDREFMSAQIEDHTHDIERFNKELAATHNEGIRRFASETVPILRQHLQLAQAVQTSLRGSDDNGTGSTAGSQSGR